MGAFIGYEDTGVWASNRERDAFLDWFAAHRCQPGDERWVYCKSEAQRWTGRCIELGELIPRGEVLDISDAERIDAITELGPHTARLLGILSEITYGKWHHSVGSKEAVDWRDA